MLASLELKIGTFRSQTERNGHERVFHRRQKIVNNFG